MPRRELRPRRTRSEPTMNIKLVYVWQKSYVTSQVRLYSYIVIRARVKVKNGLIKKVHEPLKTSLIYFCSQSFLPTEINV